MVPVLPRVRKANAPLPVRSRFGALRPGVEVCRLRFSRLLDVLWSPLQLLVDVEQLHDLPSDAVSDSLGEARVANRQRCGQVAGWRGCERLPSRRTSPFVAVPNHRLVSPRLGSDVGGPCQCCLASGRSGPLIRGPVSGVPAATRNSNSRSRRNRCMSVVGSPDRLGGLGKAEGALRQRPLLRRTQIAEVQVASSFYAVAKSFACSLVRRVVSFSISRRVSFSCLRFCSSGATASRSPSARPILIRPS